MGPRYCDADEADVLKDGDAVVDGVGEDGGGAALEAVVAGDAEVVGEPVGAEAFGAGEVHALGEVLAGLAVHEVDAAVDLVLVVVGGVAAGPILLCAEAVSGGAEAGERQERRERQQRDRRWEIRTCAGANVIVKVASSFPAGGDQAGRDTAVSHSRYNVRRGIWPGPGRV